MNHDEPKFWHLGDNLIMDRGLRFFQFHDKLSWSHQRQASEREAGFCFKQRWSNAHISQSLCPSAVSVPLTGETSQKFPRDILSHVSFCAVFQKAKLWNHESSLSIYIMHRRKGAAAWKFPGHPNRLNPSLLDFPPISTHKRFRARLVFVPSDCGSTRPGVADANSQSSSSWL